MISRKEIGWRFNALDWRFQKQILFAFLASGMSDRAWAYKKLFVFWDNCFIPVIQDLWEKYNNEDIKSPSQKRQMTDGMLTFLIGHCPKLILKW